MREDISIGEEDSLCLFAFDDFLYMVVNNLAKKKLSDKMLVAALIGDLQKLLLKYSNEKVADRIFVHRTNPEYSFFLGEVQSGDLGIRLCIVPENQKLDLYIFSADHIGLAKHRDEIRKMVDDSFAQEGATAFVKEREL